MTVTDAKDSALMFKDQAGDYFLLPLETLERGRAPEERKAHVERLIAESDDVAGHSYLLRELAMKLYDAQLDNLLIRMIVNAPEYPSGARTDAAR
jgi:hypothetical protein